MRGRGWIVLAVATVATALAGVGCGGPAGLQHRVERGETLYRIGKAYGVTYQELARANAISNADRIEVGQVITIPHASRELPVGMITPEQARGDRPGAGELPAGATPFAWPVPGPVTSDFGPRGVSHHDGIDISTPVGTVVRAARAGRVIYSDTLRGYGNLIILAHDDGYATVYAHNERNKARTGDDVRQGDAIAIVGETGKTSGPNLHFEIRKDNVARNPLYYLPTRDERRAAAPRPDVLQGAHD